MLKELSQKEYLLLRSINLKYNKYSVADIRLRTKSKILEAIRLNQKIVEYDGLLDTRRIIKQFRLY